MARYARSQGKGPQKKKRNKNNRASISIRSAEGTYGTVAKLNMRNVTKKNDGDPHVYYEHTKKNVTKSGTTKSTYKTKVKDKKAANPVKGKGKGAQTIQHNTGQKNKNKTFGKYDQVRKNIEKDKKRFK